MIFYTVENLLDLSYTVTADLFKNRAYAWEVLPELREFILALGRMLPTAEFTEAAAGVWVANTASVAESAYVDGPCIIDEGAEIRHCAFIRGSAVIGKNAVVGNSTELKNAILFDNVQVPHYNYVGDSVLGYRAHMGAGAVTSNVKSDKSPVTVHAPEKDIPTGLKKCGAMVGDHAEIGCGSVLNPGTVIGRGSDVYPLSGVRGCVPPNSIYKSADNIAEKVPRG